MDIKELLKSLSDLDEMEGADGLNLAEAELKDTGLGAGKEIKSDLGFLISVKENGKDGIYLGGGFYSNSPTYRAFEHESDENERKEIIDRIAEIVEESVNDMEDKIIAIFNEKGYRA